MYIKLNSSPKLLSQVLAIKQQMKIGSVLPASKIKFTTYDDLALTL